MGAADPTPHWRRAIGVTMSAVAAMAAGGCFGLSRSTLNEPLKTHKGRRQLGPAGANLALKLRNDGLKQSVLFIGAFRRVAKVCSRSLQLGTQYLG